MYKQAIHQKSKGREKDRLMTAFAVASNNKLSHKRCLYALTTEKLVKHFHEID